MKTNLRKISLGVMATGGIVVPIVVVASCNSSSSSDINYDITRKSNPQLTRFDIDNFRELSTLEKIFNGLTEDNLKNITVSIKPIGNMYTITLTAKEGYSIGGNKSLDSERITLEVVSLPITDKTEIPEVIARTEVTGYKLQTIETLSLLFNLGDLTQEQIDESITVALVQVTRSSENYKVTLTARDGFTINGEQSLSSGTFSVEIVDLIIQKISTVPTGIKPSDIEANKFKTFEFLSLLFEGVDFNEASLNNMNIIKIESGANCEIKLTPKQGFTINGGSLGITSVQFTLEFTDLLIERATSIPTDITLGDVSDQTALQSLEILSKLFILGSLTQTDIDNQITVSASPITAGSDVYTVSLIPKTIDIWINGESNAFESNEFTLFEAINLEIPNSRFSSDWLHLNFSIGPTEFLLTEFYQLWQQSVNIGSKRNNM
ncbi:MAG: hypothetical protein ACRCXE_00580, partial [Metamycoplasmataceae bacterium]